MENVEEEVKSVLEILLFAITAVQVVQRRKKVVHVFTVVVQLTAGLTTGSHGLLVLQPVAAAL